MPSEQPTGLEQHCKETDARMLRRDIDNHSMELIAALRLASVEAPNAEKGKRFARYADAVGKIKRDAIEALEQGE